jgi:head-tail adaptor
MPEINAFGDIVSDWERLLAALLDNLERLPEMTEELGAFRQVLAEARAAKSRQVLYAAEKQRATQDIRVAVQNGRDLASRLRAAVTSKLGARDEKLVQFRIAPLRPRRSRRRVTGDS